MANGKNSKAREILAQLHGEGSADHPLVVFQMREMEHQILSTPDNKRWWDYSSLWKTRAARRRMICVVSMSFFGQWSGNSVTSYYLPVMLESAGITSESKKLLLNGIYPVWNWRAVILLQCLAPVVIMTGLLFCPESPRW
jgi:hypothetical protein